MATSSCSLIQLQICQKRNVCHQTGVPRRSIFGIPCMGQNMLASLFASLRRRLKRWYVVWRGFERKVHPIHPSRSAQETDAQHRQMHSTHTSGLFEEKAVNLNDLFPILGEDFGRHFEQLVEKKHFVINNCSILPLGGETLWSFWVWSAKEVVPPADAFPDPFQEP